MKDNRIAHLYWRTVFLVYSEQPLKALFLSEKASK